ncbi:hypothetical protein TNCV_986001 [Trichonephila clavipes]|uniref:CCHC-type domain-containing protein n=1 Tax=Trichonephila clavipes TaxID=2585209 RepID=A0A8X6SLX5_TRICX|nr:hypothetical protein TNCV_986001 [Trichonephila clavipes]
MAKGKALERKFSDIEKQISGFITFVDTFDEDDKEVLTVKLSRLEILNIKFEEVKEEIFTSLTDAEFGKFDAKITTCNEHIQKLEIRHMRGPGKVLKVRPMFSELILNISSTIYSCITDQEVPVANRYSSLETAPIDNAPKNCARTVVMSSREGLWVLILMGGRRSPKLQLQFLHLSCLQETEFCGRNVLSCPTSVNELLRVHTFSRPQEFLLKDSRRPSIYQRVYRFSSCIQGSSESVQEFTARINKLGTQIFQSGNSAQSTAVRNANDQLLQLRFISGLRNDIRRFVLARDPLNLDESISTALIEEQNMKSNQIANDEGSGLSPSQTENSVLSALTNKLEEINLRVGRLKEASSVTARKTGGEFFNRRETVFKCFYCGIQGHRQAECRKKKRDDRSANYQPPGEAPLAIFLFSVTPPLILSIADMSISKNRLFAIITQPPGIRREGQTRLLGIGVFNAILETTI